MIAPCLWAHRHGTRRIGRLRTRLKRTHARAAQSARRAIGHRKEDTLMKTVLVTGSTGKIGSQLVPRLVAYEGIAVRALARNAEKAAPLAAAGAELALAAFEGAPAIRAAVDRADTLVLIAPAD